MSKFIEARIVDELWMGDDKEMWVASKVLRIPPVLIEMNLDNMRQLIYRAYDSLGPHEDKYIEEFNMARAELVSTIIDPPDQIDKRIIAIETEPTDDISWWLATHVLGYTPEELQVLCGKFDEDNIERELIPLIKENYKILRKIHMSDPVLQRWHRYRHVMINYFLDAIYHDKV